MAFPLGLMSVPPCCSVSKAVKVVSHLQGALTLLAAAPLVSKQQSSTASVGKACLFRTGAKKGNLGVCFQPKARRGRNHFEHSMLFLSL